MILMLDLYCNRMKFLTEYLTFQVKKRRGFVNITSDVSKLGFKKQNSGRSLSC